jgi:hypothetical protein
MFYYLNLRNQIERILSKTNLFDKTFNEPSDDETISDVKDGQLYRKLLEDIGDSLRSKSAFTFTINTDGISPFDKSKLTIWPVFLSINELPLGDRFAIENTIVAGRLILILKTLILKILLLRNFCW